MYTIIVKNNMGQYTSFSINKKMEIAYKFYLRHAKYESYKPKGEPSSSWRLVGFYPKNKIGAFDGNSVVGIDDFISMKYEDKFYKNGDCKYYIVDNDHGTIRIAISGSEIVAVKKDENYENV